VQFEVTVPTFEDKVAQRAVVMVMEAIYEQDFLPCSYGFRPGRSAHQALRELYSVIARQRQHWVLEVDVRKYFDSILHSELRTILDQRVKDGVIRRMIDKWLKAGVLEDGLLHLATEGTPQGGVVSPALSNIYLHHVLDQWFENEVKPRMAGPCTLVRFADDFVITFKNHHDAKRVLEVLGKRFARYGLTLHPTKTRLIDFRPERQGGTQPDCTEPPFDFLGFSVLQRQTERREYEAIAVVQLRKRWGRAPRDRLSGAGLKPLQAAAVKTRGRERWKKSLGQDPEQVCVRETNENKPADDASLRTKRHQNQRREAPLGQVCRVPD
jgi:group II intron reverse transcriptase/maturase